MVLDARAVIAQEKQRRAPGWEIPPNDKVRPGVGKAAEKWYHFVISKLMRNCWHFSGMAMWMWDRRCSFKGLPLPWPSTSSVDEYLEQSRYAARHRDRIDGIVFSDLVALRDRLGRHLAWMENEKVLTAMRITEKRPGHAARIR